MDILNYADLLRDGLFLLVFCYLRTHEFKTEGNLTYDGCMVNEGGAMNISDGIFSAPRKGIYQFTFHANTVKKLYHFQIQFGAFLQFLY